MKLLIFCWWILSLNAWGQCLYQISPEDIKLKFTGYKFTHKTSVSGSFKELQWSLAREATPLPSLLASASVWINTHSIDAGNAARNRNIIQGLFKQIPHGHYIRGVVNKVAPGGQSLSLKLFLGDIETQIPMTVKKTPEVLILNGSLNLINSGLGSAFNALAKICGPLHRGKDGKRKTWPTVDLELRARYREQCSP